MKHPFPEHLPADPPLIYWNMDQGSAEWFDAHRGLLTASEAKKLVTAGGKLSAQASTVMARCVAEIMGYQEPEFGGDFTSEWAERGSEMEEEARNWYAFDHDLDIKECGIAIHPNGYVGASPDGIIEDGDFLIPCEFKCPKASTHVKWMMNGGLPDDHKQQVHLQMVVLGAPYARFMSYHPDIEALDIVIPWDKYTNLVAESVAQYQQQISAFLKDKFGKEL